MSRSTDRILKEGRVNYSIRNRRKNDFQILFHSNWDIHCKQMLELVDTWEGKEGDEVLGLVSSWDLPHAFMAFKITKVPCLVTSQRGRIVKHDYLPKIREFLTSS
jgi:hypothetical protein